MKKVKIIGAGLAGCEAAYQLAKRGIQVELYEMKPKKMTAAQSSPYFAELVCSNSLRADGLTNAVGVLKQEMTMLDSLIIKAARANAVPAGGSLSVDRTGFSKTVTDIIQQHPCIQVITDEVDEIFDGPTIIATGPLTSERMADTLKTYLGDSYFYFYDAAAPIIERDSINMDEAYFKSRYDKGTADYINCPMDQAQFEAFYDALIHAERIQANGVDQEIFFEGCMPFEEVARRGPQTLLFGAMKPVGLEKADGTRPYAVVQLRQDNVKGSLYNMVGFQTRLTWGEQKRIIQMIPGLKQASIVRYGVMHKNTYLNAPKHLKPTYQSQLRDDLFFAGQMTGVEGYVESAASGLVAGLNMSRLLNGLDPIVFDQATVIGSMAHYITHADPNGFQPMNANFGILSDLKERIKKKERKEAYAQRALSIMQHTIDGYLID